MRANASGASRLARHLQCEWPPATSCDQPARCELAAAADASKTQDRTATDITMTIFVHRFQIANTNKCENRQQRDVILEIMMNCCCGHALA